MSSKFLLKIFQRLNYIFNYFFVTQINEKKLYKKYIPNNNITVFDIGSNLGTFSKQISDILKSNTLNIYSFEPIKGLLNSQKIKYGNLYKFNYIVADKNSFIDFYEHEISSQSSIMPNDKLGNQKVVKTSKEAITLEKALNLANVDQVDLLKLDTEGNELSILNSSQHLLSKSIFKIIKVEISFLLNNKYSDKNFNQINSLMVKCNYVFLGFSNAHYQDNKILFFDAFYIKDYLLS